MHRHKHRHEPTNKTQGPSAISHQLSPIGRKPPPGQHASCPPPKDPPKSGYERERETALCSLDCTAQSTVQYSVQAYDLTPCLHFCTRERALQSTAVSLMPATCNVAATKKRTHLQFRSHADGLACLEHPSIPVATSGPAQSIPTLLNRRQKLRPFGGLAHHENSQKHHPIVAVDYYRLASLPRCTTQGILAIYLGVRTDVTLAHSHRHIFNSKPPYWLVCPFFLPASPTCTPHARQQGVRLPWNWAPSPLYPLSAISTINLVEQHVMRDFCHSGCLSTVLWPTLSSSAAQRVQTGTRDLPHKAKIGQPGWCSISSPWCSSLLSLAVVPSGCCTSCRLLVWRTVQRSAAGSSTTGRHAATLDVLSSQVLCVDDGFLNLW